MSYCRFSSDDFSCDVYVYEDVYGGWTTHVAANRVVIDRDALPPAPDFPDPLPQDADHPAWKVYFTRHRALLDALDSCERVPIGLPHDGDTFNDDTPGECATRLVGLRGMGYIVPQYAIDALRQEHLERHG